MSQIDESIDLASCGCEPKSGRTTAKSNAAGQRYPINKNTVEAQLLRATKMLPTNAETTPHVQYELLTLCSKQTKSQQVYKTKN